MLGWVVMFTEETQVLIEAPNLRVPCVLNFECQPGPHSEGTATVSILQGEARHEWVDGLTFYAG